jgi:hypothetical protein
LTEYDKLVEEVRTKAEAFRSLTAKEYIPKMYWALCNENPNLKPEDARDRIEKDCINIWSNRTILDALPDEAKDLKKQKAGRLSQKEAKSAAVSAASLSTKKKKQEEIIIDTEGNPIENSVSSPPPSAPLTTTTLSPIVDVSSSGNNRSQIQNNDDDLWHLEYSFPLEYVSDIIFPFVFGKNNREYSICFEGVFDRRTRKVVSGTLAGRISSPQQQQSTVE